MIKKLTVWFFFTIIAGVLPLGIKWLLSQITNIPFTYPEICSEIFFFNVIISADGVKELLGLKNKTNLKLLLGSTLVIIIIILSALYGILLTYDYVQINLRQDSLYLYSKVFTVFCLMISFSIQLLGGVEKNEW